MKKFLPFKKFCMQSNIYALLSLYFSYGFSGHPCEVVKRLNVLLERLTFDIRCLYDGNDLMDFFSIEYFDRYYSKHFQDVLLIAVREVASAKAVSYGREV